MVSLERGSNRDFGREELRGISRGKNAKDMDWQKIAGAIEEEDDEDVIEKPSPIKISVQEVLNRVRKPTKKLHLKNSALSKKGKRKSVPVLT
jgi:chitinase